MITWIARTTRNGRIAEIATVAKIAESEIGHRMRLALRYQTQDELTTAVASFESWTAVHATLKFA